MAQLAVLILSRDHDFRQKAGSLVRSGRISIALVDAERPLDQTTAPDIVIVDARGDTSSAMASIERMRAALPAAGVFAIATVADPSLILQAMRAGANEFFTWPPDE